MLQNVGLAHANCVVITFANPEVALRILRSVREVRDDVPILVRTQDDTKLEELQRAGATEVVPETLEASLMLLSHLLLLLKLPVSRASVPSMTFAATATACCAGIFGPMEPNFSMTVTRIVKSFTA